jgi:arginine exporter protein ArgO
MVSGSTSAFFTGLVGALAYIVALGAVVALVFSLGRKRVHAQGG